MSLDVADLFATFQPRVRAYVGQRLAGVPDDVIEDMVADVFERVVRNAPRYRDRGAPPEAWLFSIARNLLIDHYRRHGKIAFVRLHDLQPYGEHVGSDAHVEQMDVALALATYRTGHTGYPPDKHLAVIRARFWEGGTDAAIGQRLGLTEASVKKLRGRALANLRKTLEDVA